MFMNKKNKFFFQNSFERSKFLSKFPPAPKVARLKKKNENFFRYLSESQNIYCSFEIYFQNIKSIFLKISLSASFLEFRS